MQATDDACIIHAGRLARARPGECTKAEPTSEATSTTSSAGKVPVRDGNVMRVVSLEAWRAVRLALQCQVFINQLLYLLPDTAKVRGRWLARSGTLK